MGTVAEKLQATLNSKTAIKSALTEKGKNPTDVLSTYAGLIRDLDKTSDGCDLANPIVNTTVGTKSRKAAAYGNGVHVAISASTSSTSLLEYSTDGVNWTAAELPVAAMWNSVAFGNGKFIAVATGTNNTAIQSTDGKNWTTCTLPSSGSWTDVTYGNNKFVALKTSSNIAAYSANGTTWTEVTLPSSTTWRRITFANGKFVAIAYSGITAYSNNGVAWTQGNNCLSNCSSLAGGNGKFVAAGASGYSYSSDGSTWTNVSEENGTTAIVFGKGMFVRAISSKDYAEYSVDALEWYNCKHGVTAQINGISYGDGKFIAVANSRIVCIPILANPSANQVEIAPKFMEDLTPEVTAQTPIIQSIADKLGVTIATPSGTNKQVLHGNNTNLQSVDTNFTGTQTKEVTAGTGDKTVSPDSGKLLSRVTVHPTPSQSKSVTPNESAQTVSPDSGKLLSSVSVGAIQTEEKTVTAGTSATTVTPTSGKYIKKITVNPTPSQSKTVSPSTSQQTVSPDSGKLMSSVVVNAMASGALSDITVSSAGLITAQVGTSGYLASGTKKTKQLTTQAAKTWTPKTTNQTIAAGTYCTGKQTIKGDSNLKAANIKKGVSIFGVTGNFPAIELAEMGFTKFSIDSFSFSSRKVWRDTVIPHSLGENPKLVYIYAESEITTANDIDSVIGVLPKKQFNANSTKIQLTTDGKVYLNDEDVTDIIRTNEISLLASDVSTIKEVREHLVALQQKMAQDKGFIMDGRDIGTVVLPDAELKIYLTASVEARAKRRYLENKERGLESNLQTLKNEILERDYQDTHRKYSPLKQATDAVVVDSTEMDKDDVVNYILELVKDKI